jgi:hypothetical protein
MPSSEDVLVVYVYAQIRYISINIVLPSVLRSALRKRKIAMLHDDPFKPRCNAKQRGSVGWVRMCANPIYGDQHLVAWSLMLSPPNA